MLPDQAFFEEVAAVFGLGTRTSIPVEVSGGLSNRLYRLRTTEGEFGIKRMVANADAPDFKANIEASYLVELTAQTAGIAMPRPVPAVASNQALARITDGDRSCWVRVHHWIPGDVVDADRFSEDDLSSLAGILATLHQLPAPEAFETPSNSVSRDWQAVLPANICGADLLNAIETMEAVVRDGYGEVRPTRVMAHRDLDAKNLLRAEDGHLIVLDWDAAGPEVAQWDAVTVAMDWSNARGDVVSDAAFDRFLAAYGDAGGQLQAVTRGTFAGWCEGVLDWFWFNLGRANEVDPNERQLGRSEVADSARFIPAATRWITNRY